MRGNSSSGWGITHLRGGVFATAGGGSLAGYHFKKERRRLSQCPFKNDKKAYPRGYGNLLPFPSCHSPNIDWWPEKKKRSVANENSL